MSFLKNIFGKKDEPINSYNDFWTWFQKNEKDFFAIVKNHKDIGLLLDPKKNCSITKISFYEQKESKAKHITLTGNGCKKIARESVFADTQYTNSDDRNKYMLKYISSFSKDFSKELQQRVRDNCRDASNFAKLSRDSDTGLTSDEETHIENQNTTGLAL